MTDRINNARDDIYSQIDTLCGKLADIGDVDEAWQIRRLLDDLNPPLMTEQPVAQASALGL